jgi:cadmium resistance protein CadD (predicted permease)
MRGCGVAGIGEIEIWGLLLLVGSSFVATNLDNLVLLVVMLGADAQNRAAVILGFLASAICVLCLSAIGAVLGANLDPGLIGYMGLAPLTMGVYLLYKLLRGDKPDHPSTADSNTGGQASGLLGSFLLMFSNSGDSVAIFFPLLAESGRDALLWIVSAFLLCALLWSALAWRIADQPRIARQIEKVGEKLVPWIMIGAGLYILLDTGTDTLL